MTKKWIPYKKQSKHILPERIQKRDKKRNCKKHRLSNQYVKEAEMLANTDCKPCGVYRCPNCDGLHTIHLREGINLSKYEPLLYTTKGIKEVRRNMSRVKRAPVIERDDPNATHWVYRVDKETCQLSRYKVIHETVGMVTVEVKQDLGNGKTKTITKQWSKHPRYLMFIKFEDALHTALSRINTRLEMLEKEVLAQQELLAKTLASEPDTLPSLPLQWKED